MLASSALLLTAAAGLVAAAPQYDYGTSTPAASADSTASLYSGASSVPAGASTTSAGLATSSVPASSLPATSTAGASGAVHTVQVGQGGLVYVPNTVIANPGDQVVFMFNPKNHTVTQSTFADPCHKMVGGFASGFMPTDPSVVGTATQPMFSITVNDTKPVWVYCGQTGHCQQGMVMAINAPASGNTFAAFQATAMGSNATAASSTNSTSNSTSTTGSSSSSGATLYTSSAAGLAVAVALSFFTLF